MPFCSECGKEAQVDWTVCPYCSNTLSQKVPLNPPQKPPPRIMVRIVKKSSFPVIKLTVIIKDPLNAINEKVSFSTMARTYTAKLANGTKIGTLPLKNLTVYSGAEGMISFPNGPSYKVKLMTGHFGPTGMIISDWDNSRKPTLVNFNERKKK